MTRLNLGDHVQLRTTLNTTGLGEIGIVSDVRWGTGSGDQFEVVNERTLKTIGYFHERELLPLGKPEINPLGHLVNGTAICERYGVAKSTLSGWQTRNGFPKPLDAPGLIGSKVWDCSEVEKWHDNWVVGRR